MVVTAETSHPPHPARNCGIPRIPRLGQAATPPTTTPRTYRIQSHPPIPGSVRDDGTSDRRSTPVSSRKQRNPNAFGIRSIRNTADFAATLGSNPISGFDSRISPRKQAIRQTDAIDIHPKTSESRGSQTMSSQPPNRPRLPSRTKTDLDGQSPNQSTEKAGTAYGRNPQSCGSREIPKLPQYSTPNRSIIPPPPADRIGFRHPIPESVRGYDQNCGGRSNGRQPTGHKNNNPAYFTEGCHSH